MMDFKKSKETASNFVSNLKKLVQKPSTRKPKETFGVMPSSKAKQFCGKNTRMDKQRSFWMTTDK